MKEKYECFLRFMNEKVARYRKEHPRSNQLDGNDSVHTRKSAGTFCYAGILWTVDFDTHFLPLEIAKVPISKRRAKVEAALAAVELSDKIKSKAANLSGGQKQRLAIARAIVNEPKILFADEPTGNLDSVTGGVVEDFLFNYSKKNHATLIVVTHDRELAEKCDAQIEIVDGKIFAMSGFEDVKTKETKGVTV